jgi:L-rhamnose-H+ transport protein
LHLTNRFSLKALSRSPHRSVALTVGFGFLWGVGSILFGSAVKMVGNSLAFRLLSILLLDSFEDSEHNTTCSIILGSCAAFGALLPLVILHPQEISSSVGYHTFAGLAIIIVALICIARAGMQKDQSFTQVYVRSPSDNSRSSPHEHQASASASLTRGVCVCLLSGLFSAALNFSLAFAGSIRASATELQSSDFGATSLVWALAVGCGGFVANAGFCLFLLFKNSSLRKFCVVRRQEAIILSVSDDYLEFDSTSYSTKTSEINVHQTAKNVFCCCSMGCLWIGGYFLYGAGCSMMGPAAAVIAWPINLCASVATANVCAWLSGEWKHTSQQTRLFLLLGLLLLFAAASVMAS